MGECGAPKEKSNIYYEKYFKLNKRKDKIKDEHLVYQRMTVLITFLPRNT
jgi:hypothetical protein